MSPFRLPPLPWSLVLLATVQWGCHSLPHDLDGAMKDRQEKWEEAVAVNAAQRPAVTVGWPQAVALMVDHNPQVAQARSDRTNAKRDTRQVWEDLLPYLSVQLHSWGRLNDANLFSWRRVGYEFFLTEYLGLVMDLPANLYAAGLREARSDIVWHAAVKEHMLMLYLAVLEQQRSAAAAKEFSGRLAFIRRHPAVFTDRDIREAEEAEAAARSKLRSVQVTLRQVLGVSHEEVVVDPATLPDWPASGAALVKQAADPAAKAFAPDRTFLALQAVEWVGLDAQSRNIKLGYWPDLSIYLSPPSVGGALDGGRANSFRIGDTTLSGYLLWRPLDALQVRDQLARLGDHRGLVMAEFSRKMDEMLLDRTRRLAEMDDLERLSAQLAERLRVSQLLLPERPIERMPAASAEIAQLKIRIADLEHQRRMRLAEYWFLSDNQDEILKGVPLAAP